MIRASIIGATGYAGGELLRVLIRHPDVQVTHVTSETSAGRPIHETHKFLKGRLGLLLEKANAAAIARNSDIVFLGLPHGTAARIAAALLDKGARVIDLSADFRLEDPTVYCRWYGEHPQPRLISQAVYGLPERYRDRLRNARLVANPGCYAAASILAGLPLAASKLLGKGPIIVDAKSGVSGAGKRLEPTYLYCQANENMVAYGLRGHRHQPEIHQEWAKAWSAQAHSGAAPGASRKAARQWQKDHTLIFVPHLTPMTRGILLTLYAPLARVTSASALRDIYAQHYLREPFVAVLAPYESAEVLGVAHTNHCHIGVSVDAAGRQAIITAALDNLLKGASGQAIQNMNLMFGLDETRGLL